jgi:iron complex outermembrane receptor protein
VLSWRPAADALIYASVTRGFTAGGFNTDASSAKAFSQTFNPEIVTNYELGLKTQWWDDSVRVNASAFEMKYRDKQELVFNSTNFILDIVNASAATAKGFEIETAYKPTRWFELTANYAKLHTVYDQFVLGTVNNTGHMLSSSPPNKYSFAADLNYPLGDAGFLIGSASYSWIDSYNTGAAADPNLQIPSYGLVNLTCGYEAADHRYRLIAWTKNLGNVDYILTRSTQVVRAEYLGEPRTFGVTFRHSF